MPQCMKKDPLLFLLQRVEPHGHSVDKSTKHSNTTSQHRNNFMNTFTCSLPRRTRIPSTSPLLNCDSSSRNSAKLCPLIAFSLITIHQVGRPDSFQHLARKARSFYISTKKIVKLYAIV